MPAPPDDARDFHGTVLRLEPCGDDGVILWLRSERPLDPIRASRFFMLRRETRDFPFIPRPFSIYRQSGDEIAFLIKIMGRGTRSLAEAAVGERIGIVGPLGNGWPALDGAGVPWVCIAGGVGSAPFPMAIEQALAGMDGQAPARTDQITLLFGAATGGLLYDLDAFRATGVRVECATDDGSEGLRGNVIELLRGLWDAGELPREVRLLACGPEPMLHAVERLAHECDLEAWLSLESLMGCGVGICNGCPVVTRKDGERGSWPNAKCCVEGPVFSVRDVTMAEA